MIAEKNLITFIIIIMSEEEQQQQQPDDDFLFSFCVLPPQSFAGAATILPGRCHRNRRKDTLMGECKTF